MPDDFLMFRPAAKCCLRIKSGWISNRTRMYGAERPQFIRLRLKHRGRGTHAFPRSWKISYLFDLQPRHTSEDGTTIDCRHGKLFPEHLESQDTIRPSVNSSVDAGLMPCQFGVMLMSVEDKLCPQSFTSTFSIIAIGPTLFWNSVRSCVRRESCLRRTLSNDTRVFTRTAENEHQPYL